MGNDRKPTRVMYWVMILTSPTLPLVRERFRPVAFLKREVLLLVVDKVSQRPCGILRLGN